MILEGIVTTQNPSGVVNVAAMGPVIPDQSPLDFPRFWLRPYPTSMTYQNLKTHPEGVLHVIDDVLLLAEAVLHRAHPELVAAQKITGHRLADCCRAYEFRVTAWDVTGPRARLTAEVVQVHHVRDFFGFHRARHAVIEAAILASRVHLLPKPQLDGELARLAPLVEKTAGPHERSAFALLVDYLQAHVAAPAESGSKP